MKYGLIGERLTHSFSKPIHETIGTYTYELKELSPDSLESFIRSKDFSGINVTIPYKSDVIQYLDFLDENAGKIGAVNTIINRNGKLYGYNTDFEGLKGLILKNGFDLKNKKVLILGSGGTGKTAAVVCESLDSSEIITVSRNGAVNYKNVHSLHNDADFIINTTPCGMYPDNYSAPVELSSFEKLEGVIDVVYNPLTTKLSLEAAKLGIKNCNGLYMLVLQAVCSARKFTDTDLDAEITAKNIYRKILAQKQNIVLIGMPGSGKTTVGKALAEKTGRIFIDTDELIKNTHGDIASIFAEGEHYFRDIETTAVKKASINNAAIIATGGGAVLRQENVDALKQNGVLFFLDRALENIEPTADRPLSKNAESLKKLFYERFERYLEVSDYQIKVDTSVENTVNRITEILNENSYN